MEFGMFHEFPSLPGRSETEAFDEVILSTLPAGISRWVHMDLPHRLGENVDRPSCTCPDHHHASPIRRETPRREPGGPTARSSQRGRVREALVQRGQRPRKVTSTSSMT